MQVVLLSGGLDSTTVLWQASQIDSVIAVFVDYGQIAAETERRVAAAMAGRTRAEFVHVRLPQLGQVAKSAICGSGDIRIAAATVVPGRNALLLSVGAVVAQSHGARKVLIGCNATDAANYADCRRDFILYMDAAFRVAYGVNCEAPLLNLSKSEVMQVARSIGVPIEQTSSCYQGRACGECVACRVLAQAIKETR